MKILKSSPFGKFVFNTFEPGNKEAFPGKIRDLDFSDMLHQNHQETDFEFLSKYFPDEHEIFENFSESFFYVLKKPVKQ